MTQIFEWTAAGIDPTIDLDITSDLPYAESGFARWEQVLAEGDLISGPVRDFPASERDRLERQGIVSILAVPIFAAGEWWGFVGYDQCEEERDWQPAEIEALSLVANTLGAAIGRERAMRTLSETEARYQTLIEQIPAVTYMESAAEPGRKLYISPQVETILGFDPAEWSHERWQRAIHPDDRERVLAEDVRAQETGEPFSCEYRMVRPDDRVVWLQDDAVLLRDDRGDPLYWQGVRFDVTAGKKPRCTSGTRSSATGRSWSRSRRSRTSTRAGSANEVGPWHTIYISPQVENILGYTPEEWSGDDALWENIIHPDDRAAAVDANRVHYERR